MEHRGGLAEPRPCQLVLEVVRVSEPVTLVRQADLKSPAGELVLEVAIINRCETLIV